MSCAITSPREAAAKIDVSETQPVVLLTAQHHADIEHYRLESYGKGSIKSSVKYCESYQFETELGLLEVTFDCMLVEPAKLLISDALRDFHGELLSSLTDSNLYDFAFSAQPNLCVKLVRANVSFSVSKSVSNCFDIYFSMNNYKPLELSELSNVLRDLSSINVLSSIYSKWVHEMFHFAHGSNNLNAKNNKNSKFSERLTNEYIAHLLEIDVKQRVFDLVASSTSESELNNIEFVYQYSIFDMQTCKKKEIINQFNELKGTELSVFYSELASDLAQFTYEKLVEDKSNFPMFIEKVMSDIGGKENSSYFESLYSYCDKSN